MTSKPGPGLNSSLRCLLSSFAILFALLDSALAVDSGCAELADPREDGLPTPPAGVPQVLCAAFFPFAVALDGSESTRVEIRIVGEGLTAVAVGNQFPIVGLEVDG